MKHCHQVAEYTNVKYERSRRIYGIDGMCPTLMTRASGGARGEDNGQQTSC